MSHASGHRWVTATVLSALARAGIHRAGQQFTAAQVAQWVHGQLTDEQRVHATTRLCALAFVVHGVTLLDDVHGTQDRADVYTLTHEGALAVQAAAEGHVRKSGPKATRAPNPVRPEATTTRLWNLMRIRKMLDSDTATQLLCDAGEQEFERLRATVRRTLHRWATCGALAESTRRVHRAGDAPSSNGCKRYVLVIDSPTPPAWRQIAKAKARALQGAA